MSDEDTSELRKDRFIPAFSDAPYGAVLGSVAAAMSAVGTASIGALMLLIVADVVGRNFLDAPITGVSEIAARAVVAIVFLQVPAAILQLRLTRADFLVRRLQKSTPKVVAGLESVFCLAGAIVFALILLASWPKFLSAWQSTDFFGVQGVWTIPTWPFRGITILGCTVAALAALYRARAELRGLRSTA
ncbi:TRAP transporter small permease subunit [Roseobacter sp. HKCCD9010]|uniref:TRAP transporter small permease subunit n=1 Tax=unclassified Roseobacter TaxID=196798 RepID=UPI0014923771|nr:MULTISPECIES: TRAP transporter small permease [unclassified Roseobacter]MBF9052065.1 TRAP transporter small permease subunit [Rhodobacterales bacterium HKCCD4356]NNV13987.1 TRAP transporter small permease subunit [Roseobacter sp. HKCCD7357]NNV18228.1 TRAP transporter small permease subunit [Roseobacter sp. HKCCD8768]NNV27686.1 TRAP transporter small permease subunit [Roseobacter sp. HKCCD8192]NNV31929.1 TRAP transporter small permease subunit [Roseobacter sp. HKCCD9061]